MPEERLLLRFAFVPEVCLVHLVCQYMKLNILCNVLRHNIFALNRQAASIFLVFKVHPDHLHNDIYSLSLLLYLVILHIRIIHHGNLFILIKNSKESHTILFVFGNHRNLGIGVKAVAHSYCFVLQQLILVC